MPGGLHPPLELYHAWQTDQFPHGERRDWSIVIIVTLFGVLAYATVAARLWARVMVNRNSGLDDALIVVALIFTSGLAISVMLGSRLYGFDRHIWDLTPTLGVQSREITMAIEATYIIATGITKISILCFYRRIASGTVANWFLYTTWTSIAFVIAYMIAFLGTLFFGCSPISAFWNQVDIDWLVTNKGKWHCINEPGNLLAASSVSIVQDFLACGLPYLLLRKLQMSRRQKIALTAVFGVGIFLCVTGILRIYYIRLLFYTTYDITWAAQPCWLWTAVEAELAIVCASAPALKPFFGRILHASGITAIGGSGSNNSAVGRRTPNFGGGAKSPRKKMMGSTSFSLGDSNDASIADRSMSPSLKKQPRDFEMEQLAKHGTDVSITTLPPYSPAASGPVSPVSTARSPLFRRSSRTTPSSLSFGEPPTRYGFEADISGGNDHHNHHHHHHYHHRKASSKLPDLERGSDWDNDDDDNDSPDDDDDHETAYHPLAAQPSSPAAPSPTTLAAAAAPLGGIKVEQRVDVDFSGNEQWPLALSAAARGIGLGPNVAPPSALPVPLEPRGYLHHHHAPPYPGGSYAHGAFGSFPGFGDKERERGADGGGSGSDDNLDENPHRDASDKRGAAGSRTGSDEVTLVEIGGSGSGRGAGGGGVGRNTDAGGGGGVGGVGRSASSSSSAVPTSHHARIVRKFFG
ncbi:hypothetical protein IWX46DRAFT_371515 [Phyllosticta citricarpa]|uniref:Rhodopsin domain-containing protein n=1 Tax=Phyllosticta citricarpa TaxID=55181 RepID=A0ABR1LC20_9PEZI